MTRLVLTLIACLGLADSAMAQGKSGKSHKQVERALTGKSIPPGQAKRAVSGKPIPPGQLKRYTRGQKLPADLRWEDIGDIARWRLPPPGRGNRYIRIDDQILEVTRDIATVVAAVGIVSELLN